MKRIFERPGNWNREENHFRPIDREAKREKQCWNTILAFYNPSTLLNVAHVHNKAQQANDASMGILSTMYSVHQAEADVSST